jgi:predicted nucleic acid-binding protein
MTFYSSTMPRKKSSHVFQILSQGAAVLTTSQDFSMGRGEAEAIALALVEKAQFLGIDDKNGIHACKLSGITLTTAVGILIRSREEGLLEESEVLEKLASLAKHETPRRDLTRAFVTLRASSLLPLRTHREFVRYFVP